MQAEAPMARPATPIQLGPEEREVLELRLRNGGIRPRMAERARIILLADSGLANREVARRLKIDEVKVSRWRRRFAAAGIPGLADAPRPGRPSKLTRTVEVHVKNRSVELVALFYDARGKAAFLASRDGHSAG